METDNRRRPTFFLFRLKNILLLLLQSVHYFFLLDDCDCWAFVPHSTRSTTDYFNGLVGLQHRWKAEKATQIKVYSSIGQLEKKDGQVDEQPSPRSTGHPHTEESRAKISAANKGKTPWNKGRKHSPETLEKIRQKTKEAMIKRKTETAKSLGYNTLEEYEAVLEAEKKAKKAKSKTRKTSEETKKKISEKLKARWRDPAYREKAKERAMKNLHSNAGFGNRTHSEETRRKIAEKTRLNWQNPEYRAKMTEKASNVSEETRKKISETLKARWQDAEFRGTVLKNQTTKSKDHRERIAEAIRAKWADPEYRSKMEKANAEKRKGRLENPNYTPKKRAPRPRKPKKTATVASSEQVEPAVPKKRPKKIAQGKRVRFTGDDLQNIMQTGELPKKKTRKYTRRGQASTDAEDETKAERRARLKTEASDLWDAIYADGEMDEVQNEDDNKIFSDDDSADLFEEPSVFEDIL